MITLSIIPSESLVDVDFDGFVDGLPRFHPGDVVVYLVVVVLRFFFPRCCDVTLQCVVGFRCSLLSWPIAEVDVAD